MTSTSGLAYMPNSHAHTLSRTEQGAATAAVDIRKKPRRLSERTKNNSAGSGSRPLPVSCRLCCCAGFSNTENDPALRPRFSVHGCCSDLYHAVIIPSAQEATSGVMKPLV